MEKINSSLNGPSFTLQQELKLVATEFISVNHYLSYRVVYKKSGKPMAMSYKNAEASRFQREFTRYVKEEVEKQGWVMSKDPYQHYYVDAVFYFPRVDVDCNNYWKVLLDSITDAGCVWLDDNSVCERVLKVVYDNKNPRIELTIHPVEFVGIFDDMDELEQFEDMCKGCRRYLRNCSILRKAKEGRIQDEIIDQCCEKYKALAKEE